MAQVIESDRKTLGLTPANRQIYDKLLEEGWFKEGIDLAKFAMSVAIERGVPAEDGKVEGTETVWNVGSFDPDAELRNLIPILFPETETPYRLVEFYVNAGLKLIGEKMAKDPYFELHELFSVNRAPSNSS